MIRVAARCGRVRAARCRRARRWLPVLAASFASLCPAGEAPPRRPNVLFIAVDDLNHWVGYLGRNPQTRTPHIDRLAARGVWFTRSYCATPAHVQGKSIRTLLADPTAAWSDPAVCTFGFKNHAVRTEAWRYIRYANGDEELYDERADPFEWVNLAAKPDTAARKTELARHLPAENKPEAGGRAKTAPAKKAKAKGKAEARAEK
ncbi:MAG TPA: hypothetical protein DCM87_20590 [Planctomycetes bacterium]|nr:hypothetical protein [Planctomycetota bacterium]